MAAGLGISWWLSGSSTQPAPAPATQVTLDSSLTTDPALSRDGKRLAFASDRAGHGNLDIWIQQVPGGEPVALTNDPADDYDPSFSPDGGKIMFRSEREGGGVYLISALAGAELRIAAQGREPRFSPDGKRIAYSVSGAVDNVTADGIYVAGVTGAGSRLLTSGFTHARAPIWMADDEHLLFRGKKNPEETSAWWLLPVKVELR